jgi:hypothetical protein
VAVSATLVDSFTSTTVTQVHSKTCNLGTPSADRIIAVAIDSRSSATPTVTSVTIGSINAVKAVERDENGTTTGRNISAVWYALVPDGTSADVVVVYSSGTIVRGGFGVVAVTGADTSNIGVTVTSMQAGTGSITANFTPARNGLAIASIYQGVTYQRLMIGTAQVTAGTSTTISMTQPTGVPVWSAPFSGMLRVDLSNGTSAGPSTLAAVVFYEPLGLTPINATSSVTLDSTTSTSITTSKIIATSVRTLDSTVSVSTAISKIAATSVKTLDSVLSPGGVGVSVLAQSVSMLNDVASSSVVSISIKATSSRVLDSCVSLTQVDIKNAATSVVQLENTVVTHVVTTKEKRFLTSVITLDSAVTFSKLRFSVYTGSPERTITAYLQNRQLRPIRQIRQISARYEDRKAR